MEASNLSLLTKVKVYEALVIPVFTYGSECWTSKKCDEMKMSDIEKCSEMSLFVLIGFIVFCFYFLFLFFLNFFLFWVLCAMDIRCLK